ncbi:MAG: hypothetical protein ACM3IL_04115 [Deltaproteobacteria bacterium]
MDTFNLLLSAIVFLIYGTICIISIIFTFFLDLYHKIDQALNISVIKARVLSPIERNITFIDDWLIDHNSIVGPFLVLLSLIDLKLSFNIINLL